MCVSCAVLQPFREVTENFASMTFNHLSYHSLLIFKSFVSIWFVLTVIKLLKGKLIIPEIISSVLIFSLIGSLLINNRLFWEYIYTPLHQATMGLISIMVQTNLQNGPPVRDLNGLLATVEKSMLVVMTFGERIFSNGSWTTFLPALCGVFLIVPFGILWAYFLFYTLEYLLAFLTFGSLSPLFILAAAFSATRAYAFSMLKFLLQSILTMVFSIIAIGFTLVGFNHATTMMNLTTGDSEVVNTFSTASVKLIALIVLGFVAIGFQKKAPAFASSIMGTQGGSSGMSGLLVGSVLGVTWALKKVLDAFTKPSQSPNFLAGDASQRVNHKLRGT
jgi:hypothetical protein